MADRLIIQVVADSPDPTVAIHGVVAHDASAAIYAVVSLTTSPRALPPPARLPGLDPDRTYRLQPLGAAPSYGSLTSGWSAMDRSRPAVVR